jgi:CheY-like chemotaxis protein
MMASLLIADDNDEMREMIRELLADLADAVYECCNGSQALTAYAAHQPDWVVMDLQMPELDGIRATKKIRAAFPTAQIVILTQYDDARYRAAALAAGACRYVLKDDLLQLRAVIAAA